MKRNTKIARGVTALGYAVLVLSIAAIRSFDFQTIYTITGVTGSVALSAGAAWLITGGWE